MMIKKAQAQIITTVLIILLVLAAIVIVWQVINSTVRQGTSTLEEKVECIGLSLDIIDLRLDGNNSDQLNVSVTRFVGGPDDPVTLILLVDGTIRNYTGTPEILDELESKWLSYPGYASSTIPGKVEVAGQLANGVKCDFLACEGIDC